MNSRIMVELKNTVINNCYQLTMGNATPNEATIVSAYNSQFGSVANLDAVSAASGDLIGMVEDLINHFSGSAGDVNRVQTLKGQYTSMKATVQNSTELSSEDKQDLLNKITDLENKAQQISDNPCLCACGTPGGRQGMNTNTGVFNVQLAGSCPLAGMKDATNEVVQKIDQKRSCKPTERHSLAAIIRSDGDTDGGDWWGRYIWAHHMIEEEYIYTYGSNAYAEYSIPTSSAAGNTGYADIVNRDTGEIFEIKYASEEGIRNGIKEIENYVKSANMYCGFSTPGKVWKAGTNWYGRSPGMNNAKEIYCYPCAGGRKLKYWLQQPGIVLYTFPGNESPELQPENIPQFIPGPYANVILERLKKIMNQVKKIPAGVWLGGASSVSLTTTVNQIVAQNLEGLPLYTLLAVMTAGAVLDVGSAILAVGTAGWAAPVAVVTTVVVAAVATYALDRYRAENNLN